MPTPRISASSYSNTAPLVWSFMYGSQHGAFELILDNAPARSAELLAQNRVDAALVPVIEYQRIDDALLVPDVCVGAREKVRSVCLVTGGIDLPDVKTVALDISSKTSVALTRIIFREFYGFEPEYRTAKPDLKKMLAESDCALLIGDPALTVTNGHESSTIQNQSSGANSLRKFDLVEIWREFTGFGFVFAMWMANKGKREIAKKIDFAAARDEGLAHIDEIISNYESGIALDRDDFRKYLSENISYTVSDSMEKGLKMFFRLAVKNRLIEAEKKLSFL